MAIPLLESSMSVPIFQLPVGCEAGPSQPGLLPGYEMCDDSFRRHKEAKQARGGKAAAEERGILIINAKVLDTKQCCYVGGGGLHSILVARGKLQTLLAQPEGSLAPTQEAGQHLVTSMDCGIASIIDCQGMTVMPGAHYLQ